ncbi:all trans-polyprenyl-diphosphate synthase PDSS1 isoform X2 [Drosophila sulfurigaster albostrigata]|uniref:all trans-polyprenyl-diphosphate synthase PDSS1 isoform X2 n=1 Tax=Drosophila sulfurigaster albostrigata TaxID=89887 RepID=UPI002D21C2F6|nr:all trans-polyprenyl-diphosphate synthase PDSS1 isoform X2 [Drosophila sulfurigaster albostrigata]
MACLSTSYRVACGSRRQQVHKFIGRLLMDNNSMERQLSSLRTVAHLTSPLQGYRITTVQSSINKHTQLTQWTNGLHRLSFNAGQEYMNSMHNSHTCSHNRNHSSVHTQQPAGPVREIQIDPYIILDDELKYFYDDVRDLLQSGTSQPELDTIACYYFDGQGKALRPMVTMLMAKALNYHLNNESHQLVHKQRQIALFSEMVHSASLVHDDVIDQSDFRRGKPSVNALWNHKKVTMAGDYILSIASIMISRLRSDDVTIVLSKILTDLVQGEFMQLGSRETENERFAHYLTKTYRKTASLIANALKATAVIAQAEDNVAEVAFQYGRNIGLAFQLVDDMLDFVSSTEQMGKPTAADLKLGLATAPVLFACEKISVFALPTVHFYADLDEDDIICTCGRWRHCTPRKISKAISISRQDSKSHQRAIYYAARDYWGRAKRLK